jgi:hypothetical protein
MIANQQDAYLLTHNATTRFFIDSSHRYAASIEWLKDKPVQAKDDQKTSGRKGRATIDIANRPLEWGPNGSFRTDQKISGRDSRQTATLRT